MGKSRYRIVTEGATPHILTSTVVNWLPVFGNPAIAQIIIDSLRFLQENKRLSIHAYVIMENHLHLIASGEDLTKEIGHFKSFTARNAIDWFLKYEKRWTLEQLKANKAPHKTGQVYQFWQEGSHPQLIQDDAMLFNKLEYIHENPVRRGYVDDPADWRYSSYRNYMELEAVLPIETIV
jgi:REP element-mobilizing transposase RayT